jgi:hypothetical protein
LALAIFGSPLSPAHATHKLQGVKKLERILRACLYHVLADRESVETFSDDDKLKSAFPVLVKKAERKETDEILSI